MKWAMTIILGTLAFIHADSGQLLRRGLIKFDDTQFIGPLQNLSLASYFGDYLWRENAYAFPVRDILYLLDFTILKATSYSPFLTINILWFMTFIYIFQKISSHLLPNSWALAATSLVAFHPHSVQLVQWISARKHLMVATFGATMVYIALRKSDPDGLSMRELLLMGAFSAAISLSYPSGVTIAVLVAAIFMAGAFRKSAVQAFTLCMGLSVPLTAFFANRNGDFHHENILTLHWSDVSLTLTAVGRMFINMLAPWQPSIYYHEDSPWNWIGLATIPVAGLLYVGLWFNASKQVRHSSMAFLFGAVAIFAPHVLFLLGYREFVAADRYDYLPFPYLVLSFCLVLQPVFSSASSRSRFIGACLIAAASLAGASVSFLQVPLWRSESELFSQCTKVEGAPKCWAMRIENGFNAGRCPLIHPWLEPANEALSRLRQPERAVQLYAELPLYEGLCTATQEAAWQARMDEIVDFERKRGEKPGLAFGKILLLLEAGRESEAALLFANATIGSIGRGLSSAHNRRTLEVFWGQAQYLCTALKDLRDACKQSILPEIEKRLSPNPGNAVDTAMQLTRNAHLAGQRR